MPAPLGSPLRSRLPGPSLLVALMMLAGLAVVPATVAAPAGPSVEVGGSDRAGAVARRSPCDLSLQVGWLERAGNSRTREGKATFLIVGDVVALWGNRTGAGATGDSLAAARSLTRRGLVVHLSGDDDGGRHGLGYVHRRSLQAGRGAYVQFAPVLILAASDNYRTVRRPSAYLSFQAGNEHSLALCLAVEITRYRHALVNYAHAPDDPPGWNSLPVFDDEGTEVAWHVGGVLHGWPGVAGLVALGLGVGLAMGSSGL